MPVIMFATSGITGQELEALVKTLSKSSCVNKATNGAATKKVTTFVYESAISLRTTLLIASTSTSTKFVEARRRRIPTVTPNWVAETGGDMALWQQYAAPPLLGQLLSTAALDALLREEVKRLCGLTGACYQASLCRRCTLLVVPAGGVPSGNEKVLFAHKHGMRLVTMDEFRFEYGRCSSSGSGGGGGILKQQQQLLDAKGRTAVQPPPPPPPPLLPVVTETPLVQNSLAGVCCYCVPSPVPPSVVRTLVAAQCHRVPAVTPATTHIVVWREGSACDTMLTSPGDLHQKREVVSLKWVEACLAAQRRVPETLYRIQMLSAPVLTFSGMSVQEKARLTALVTTIPSLAATVQDNLVLGSVEQLQRDPRHGELRLTTHLVLPSLHESHLDTTVNKKVEVMIKRFIATKRAECRLVSVAWLTACVEARQWVDVSPYEQPIRHVVAANLARALQRQQQQQQQQTAALAALVAPPACDAVLVPPPPLRTTSVPHVVEHADATEHGPLVAVAAAAAAAEAVVPEYTPSRAETQIVLSLEALVAKLEDQGTAAAATRRMPTPQLLLPAADPHPLQRSFVRLAPAAALPNVQQQPLWLAPQSLAEHRLASFAAAIGVSAAAASLACLASPPVEAESQVVYYCHSQGNAGLAAASPVLAPPPPLAAVQPLLSRPFPADADAAAPLPRGAPRIFLAKSIKDDAAAAARIVEALGGSLVDAVEDCTHFLVPKPAKTETFLRCIAGGKWILAPTYLTRCEAAGCFVDEQEDEWGTSMVPVLPQGGGGGSITASVAAGMGTLADACPLQRTRTTRAFVTWRAVLACTDMPRARSFGRVLQAGGCTSVVCVSPGELTEQRAARLALRDATHVLCDDGCLSEETVGLIAQEAQITVHRMELMVHVLCTMNPSPELFTAAEWLAARKRPRASDDAAESLPPR